VNVAPLTVSIFALWAVRASLARTGVAAALIEEECGTPDGARSVVTPVIFPLEIVTCTWTAP